MGPLERKWGCGWVWEERERERERERDRERERERRIGLKRFNFIRLIIYYLLDHSHSPLRDWIVKTA